MNDLLQAFGINWSSLIAQTINFAILIFLLARYVYKPILNIIDERKRLVTESMEKVKEIDRHKEKVDQDRAAILRKADEEAGVLLERAKKEAELMHAEIEKNARLQADQIIKKGNEHLEAERSKLVKEMQDKMAHTIVQSAEKILRREFSKEDQESFEEELKKNIPSMLS